MDPTRELVITMTSEGMLRAINYLTALRSYMFFNGSPPIPILNDAIYDFISSHPRRVSPSSGIDLRRYILASNLCSEFNTSFGLALSSNSIFSSLMANLIATHPELGITKIRTGAGFVYKGILSS